MIDLKSDRSDIHIIALNFSLNTLNLSGQVRNVVNYRVLRLKESLHGRLARLKLGKVLGLSVFPLEDAEALSFELTLLVNGLDHG